MDLYSTLFHPAMSMLLLANLLILSAYSFQFQNFLVWSSGMNSNITQAISGFASLKQMTNKIVFYTTMTCASLTFRLCYLIDVHTAIQFETKAILISKQTAYKSIQNTDIYGEALNITII